ncbi:DUF1080 domain-containing protein [Nocardioides sp. MAH-18]|uniref:DUF1080 domain-containing protein n=1 Tax=Nocardioides agri TaxID=2682843 RepID=A0A6L6XZB2_9ACTN|nr:MULTISPECIES: 5'-nucleotidase C-terminal domain-containing protein [unclassified Nocardioides]MBA2952584.1 5'-nucleotidase C-terminal domain-containing protein [Nocardioides sp. CGMCC 1.13656]MVQ51746.1 DUF1080 domain-containing protein [Nocardioides sp. MAH-18]
MTVLSRPARACLSALTLLLTAVGAVVVQPATAAVGGDVIAWVEVENGLLSGGPAFNSGDHGNFSGTGSYTFRETGMTSTMSVTAPAAGVYPVYVRYAAGPLGPDENVTRSMGLLTNGGARQLMTLPMTSYTDWETWRFVRYDVVLDKGANTIAIQCDRATDFCRLNFDAIQVGGTAPDPCAAAPTDPGYTPMFDGTFDSLDRWRKAGAGGFGRQTGCFIRGLGGRGATWYLQQQTGDYTLQLDWRLPASDRQSSVYLASSSRSGADPVGGFRIPIGTGTGAIVPTGGTARPADAAAVARALKPVGEWNTYTVQVTAARIRVLLNGTLVSSFDPPGAISTTGHVGLENNSVGNGVDFKDIEVQPGVELGRIAAPARRAVSPAGESSLGNLVAEAERWASGARIAFVHPEDLGADLVGRAGGYPATVTQQEAASVLPSDDTLVTTTLTGQQVRGVLEQQWQGLSARLGTSAGLSYTFDPTAAAGSRVTGLWLDGTAVDPVASYEVVATGSLALGGGAPHDTGLTGQDALAAYLEAVAGITAGSSPLRPDVTHHAVGVAFPGGARASYAAGEAVAVDLSALAFSAPSDPRDTSVQVSLGGRALGAFPVDDQGAAAVRTAIPVDAPPGPAILAIAGTTTGTTVRLPISVLAAPAAGGGGSALPSPPVVEKAPAKIVAKVRPKRVVARTTRARLAVVVSATGPTPTGAVKVKVGTRTYLGHLRNGTATVRIARFAKAGTVRATVSYLGDSATAPASETIRIRVLRAVRR